MVYNVLDVCRHIVNYSNEQEYGISNLKLQKVLYFVQAFFLINTQNKCFEQKIEAWDFGPVIPEAYREYKQFGSGDIPTVSYIIIENPSDFWQSKVVKYKDDIVTESDKQLIDLVVDEFSEYSASDLVELTHRQSPWKDAYIPHMNKEITTEAIKEYFNG